MGDRLENFKTYFLNHYRQHIQLYQISAILVALGIIVYGISTILLKSEDEPVVSDEKAPMTLRTDAEMTLDLLIDLIYQAHGGRARMGNVNSYVRSGVLTVKDGEIYVIYTYKRPNKMAQRLIIQNQSIRFVWDGEQAWKEHSTAGRKTEKEILNEEESLDLAANTRLAAPLDQFFTIRSAFENFNKEQVDGRPAWVLSWQDDDAEERYRFYVDTKTFLLFRRERIQLDPKTGETVETVVVNLENYSPFDGIQFPLKEDAWINGEWKNSYEIEEYQVNPGVLDNYFSY